MQARMAKSNTNLPLVRLSTVNPFLLELDRRKVDTGALLLGMGLPGTVPATDEVFVSALTIYQLIENTASVANDSYLGFSIGQDLDLQAWGPIASAAAEAGTIGDLLNRFIRGARLSFPTEWQFEAFEKSAFHAGSQSATASPIPGSLIDSIHFALSPHVHETNLTVERAAKICGFSRRRLSRDLRKKGTTLTKEIANLRARRAGKALVESDCLISEVALSVGFVDPTVFSRAFKNWIGQSPQEYRKQHRT